jgi:hypothetical protein
MANPSHTDLRSAAQHISRAGPPYSQSQLRALMALPANGAWKVAAPELRAALNDLRNGDPSLVVSVSTTTNSSWRLTPAGIAERAKIFGDYVAPETPSSEGAP